MAFIFRKANGVTYLYHIAFVTLTISAAKRFIIELTLRMPWFLRDVVIPVSVQQLAIKLSAMISGNEDRLLIFDKRFALRG